ncbi:MAG: hypothetical protein KAT68_00590 [Bacteroidales bacterium]|nr:hypothetical protein [Bacteroidales bacterium]
MKLTKSETEVIEAMEESQKSLRKKIGLKQRIILAYKAFMIENYRFQLPYQYYCKLAFKAYECDNNRRKSKCNNQAKVALANPFVEIKIEESEHFYHVCLECSKKYIGTDGEDFDFN